jgi:hypothetical protein
VSTGIEDVGTKGEQDNVRIEGNGMLRVRGGAARGKRCK